MTDMPLDFAAARAARLYSPKASPEDMEGAVYRAVQQASVDHTGKPLAAEHAEAIAIGTIKALSEHFDRLTRREPVSKASADPDDDPPHPEHVPIIRILKSKGCDLPENALGRILAFVAAGGAALAAAEGSAHDQA
ncbi:protein of unknown function [Methylorubrum extorquens]|uniref:Uncharacterized protein n=1 Tax=Methylorubrum extorquens TaxID=408 RepID=A0A2N9ASK9_METEX|nr:protein of unknown function [Methylorubrum extorquens]